MPSTLSAKLLSGTVHWHDKTKAQNTVSGYKQKHFVPILETFREEIIKPEKCSHPIIINEQLIVQ